MIRSRPGKPYNTDRVAETASPSGHSIVPEPLVSAMVDVSWVFPRREVGRRYDRDGPVCDQLLAVTLPAVRRRPGQGWRQVGRVNDFRKDCLRELKKIKDAWPDLHYSTAKGALILSPSPPRIANCASWNSGASTLKRPCASWTACKLLAAPPRV